MKGCLVTILASLFVYAAGKFECSEDGWFQDPDDCRIGHICNDGKFDQLITICNSTMFTCTMFNKDFMQGEELCIPMDKEKCGENFCKPN